MYGRPRMTTREQAEILRNQLKRGRTIDWKKCVNLKKGFYCAKKKHKILSGYAARCHCEGCRFFEERKQ